MQGLTANVAAVALPATILKMADVIDNPWQIAVDRSRKAGAGKENRKYKSAKDSLL